MLNFSKINALAAAKAEEELTKRFDAEAYLVFVISHCLMSDKVSLLESGDLSSDELKTVISRITEKYDAFRSLNERGLDAKSELNELLNFFRHLFISLYKECNNTDYSYNIKDTIEFLYDEICK